MNILINLKYTLAVTAGVCSSFAYAQKHPHIILIMTDQQRADAIGCMGNDAVISPNLDALAAEGTLFMNGYSSCPSSTPARAGLLLLGIMACWDMEKYLPNINTKCHRC